MASFTYTAKRQIKAGHVLSSDYTITIDLQRLDGGTPERVGPKPLVSLSGQVVTVTHHIQRIRPILTDWFEIVGGVPDDADFDEFFSSVVGGETFTFNDGADHVAMMQTKATPKQSGPLKTYSFTIRLL